MTRTCVYMCRAPVLTLIYSRTQTRTTPEQNSIINGLIAQVELLWESEPATLNKIKPLLYIFIIPNRVLNCKCISETHHRPSLLCSLTLPPSLLSHYSNPLHFSHSSSLSPSLPVACIHGCAHTHTHTPTINMLAHVWTRRHTCTCFTVLVCECMCVCLYNHH